MNLFVFMIRCLRKLLFIINFFLGAAARRAVCATCPARRAVLAHGSGLPCAREFDFFEGFPPNSSLWE